MARDRKRHVVRPTGPEPVCAPVVEAPPPSRPPAQSASPAAPGAPAAPDELTFAQRVTFALGVAVFACVAGVIIVPTCSYFDRESANHHFLDAPPPPVVSAWDGGVESVRHYLRGRLRDPDSLVFDNWGELHHDADGGYHIACRYRAKNGFGGYNVCTQQFVLNASGEVVDVRDIRLPSE